MNKHLANAPTKWRRPRAASATQNSMPTQERRDQIPQREWLPLGTKILMSPGDMSTVGLKSADEVTLAVLSADCGIAWNMLMRKCPRAPREWIFATPQTPHIIAKKLCSATAGKFCIVHSEERHAADALSEMLDAIIAAGGERRAIALSVGGSLLEVGAAAVIHFSRIFGIVAKQIEVLVVPSAQTPSAEFEHIENYCTQVPIPKSGSLRERLAHEILLADPHRALAVGTPKISNSSREMPFSAVSPEVAMAKAMATNEVARSGADIIVLTGSTGSEIALAAEALRRRLVELGHTPCIVSERDVARVRAGIESAINEFTQRVRKKETLVIAAPNPRRSDRELFPRLCTKNGKRPTAVVAWVTRPGHWASRLASNSSHANEWPGRVVESSISQFANFVQFEPPGRDGSALPLLRLV